MVSKIVRYCDADTSCISNAADLDIALDLQLFIASGELRRLAYRSRNQEDIFFLD